MADHRDEQMNLDNWHAKVDDSLHSIFGNDPVEWMQSWGLLSIFCLVLLPLSALAYIALNNSLLEIIFNFFFFCPVVAVVGAIRYLKTRSNAQTWDSQTRYKKVESYFLSIWILGVISNFSLNAYTALHYLDCAGCGQGDQFGSLLFAFLWVVFPIYFWWKAKHPPKHTQVIKLE